MLFLSVILAALWIKKEKCIPDQYLQARKRKMKSDLWVLKEHFIHLKQQHLHAQVAKIYGEGGLLIVTSNAF